MLGYMDPQYLRIMDETSDLLRGVFGTANDLTFPVSGAGSAGMEAALVNVLEPGDRVVIAASGFFGQRMAQKRNILLLLAALGRLLREEGARCDPGAGLAAAAQAYQKVG